MTKIAAEAQQQTHKQTQSAQTKDKHLQPVKVGILGLGTVGSGTVNVLHNNRDEITRRAGRAIDVTHVALRDIKKKRDCNTQNIELSTDPFSIVNQPDIDVVVELIGGTDIARELVLQAIANGKHVVTANKALIAHHGNEIFAQAQKHGVVVAFEAAVAGGIPIIKSIREGLAGNRIEWLAGIINGTCNYILTQMQQYGRDFAEVLSEAQKLGYAEADPSFDIDGVDVAHKLTILASIAFGIPLQYNKVYVEGIRNITQLDVSYAEQLGYRIKHLGFARRQAQGIELRVHPCFISQQCLLAHVDGVMNAVLVEGDAVGQTLYYGAGAGANPTASSVVADLVEVVRTLTTDSENRVPHLAFQADALSTTPIMSIEAVESVYYIRMQARDEAGVLAEVTQILSELNISMEAILQKDRAEHANHVHVVILTHKVPEKHLNTAIERIEALPGIAENVLRVRVVDL